MFILLFVIVGIISVLGNILVIFIIRKSKELRHSQYVYKSSIAVADIIWGFTISYVFLHQCFFIFRKDIDTNKFFKFNIKTSYSKKSDLIIYHYKTNISYLELTSYNYGSIFFAIMLIFVYFVMPITIFVSIITLVFSTVDRYCALTFPFIYKSKNTRRLAKIISTLIWVTITFLYILFIRFVSRTELYSPFHNFILQPCLRCTTESKMQKFNMIVIFVSFFLLWVLTILTLVSLRKNYEKSKTLNRRAQEAFAAEKQMSVILIVMVFAFTFSLLPTMYNYIYSTFFKSNLDYMFFGRHTLSNFIYASFLATNSIWNVIIYNVFNKNFRVAFMKLFKSTFKCFNDSKS